MLEQALGHGCLKRRSKIGLRPRLDWKDLYYGGKPFFGYDEQAGILRLHGTSLLRNEENTRAIPGRHFLNRKRSDSPQILNAVIPAGKFGKTGNSQPFLKYASLPKGLQNLRRGFLRDKIIRIQVPFRNLSPCLRLLVLLNRGEIGFVHHVVYRKEKRGFLSVNHAEKKPRQTKPDQQTPEELKFSGRK
jgi:hypothetical protein